MQCPICEAQTRVTRTYEATLTSRTVERVCETGHKLVYKVDFVRESKKRGDGAYALAQELRKGRA